ncbi:hypothetical protein [Leptonema illini]|uniref:hypothetical protein n=1 Tax=Leptonema illini TaxID=183 RepID=UPI000594C871|nr:hypothetical protein [Leptonema illini]
MDASGLPFKGPNQTAGQFLSDTIVARELKGVNFSYKPIYDSNLKNAGEAVLGQKSFIGPQAFNPELIGKRSLFSKPLTQRQTAAWVQLHEDLHQRIFQRAAQSSKWRQLFKNPTAEHKYMDEVLNRYFQMRGW